MMKRLSQKIFNAPYLLLMLAPLLWSGNFVVGRAVRATLPPIGFAFWRWLIASLIVLIAARRHLKRDRDLILKHWKILLAISLFGIAMFNTLSYIGLRFTSAINGVLLQSVIPIAIMALSYLFFRQTITRLQAFGVIMSLGGVLFIITQGKWNVLLTLSLNIGDLMIFIAVVGYAVYSVLLQKRPAIHPLSLLSVTFVMGTCMLFPFYCVEHFAWQPMPLNRITLFAVGYVAIFPSIIAYSCFNRGVELIGANRAGLFIHLMPVFGSLLAMIFLGETFKLFHGVGIALILIGIWLATKTTPH